MENFLLRLKMIDQSFAKRLLVVILLIPFGITIIVVGGWVYNVTIIAILSVAAWEFWRIFHRGGYHPSRFILILGTGVLALFRALFAFQGSDFLLGLIILAAMADQTIRFGKEDSFSAVNFSITVAGVLYLGWLGSFLISIRWMTHGLWLLLLILPIVWLADIGAYLIGRKFGRHKLAPLVSPNKTWEGYLGGVVFAVLSGGLLVMLWNQQVYLMSVSSGVLMGLVLGVITPLGDLGESMIKRQFGVKDSGNSLPGHGGFLDRIDSWLWAVFIGYYLLQILL